MQRDMAETKRRIEAARRKIPSLDTYAATMKRLQQLESDLEKERAVAADLCEKLESPQAPQEKELAASVAAQSQGMGMAASLRVDGALGAADSKDNGDGTQAGQGRSRLLKGMDPEPEQLAAKIEVLEERSVCLLWRSSWDARASSPLGCAIFCCALIVVDLFVLCSLRFCHSVRFSLSP